MVQFQEFNDINSMSPLSFVLLLLVPHVKLSLCFPVIPLFSSNLGEISGNNYFAVRGCSELFGDSVFLWLEDAEESVIRCCNISSPSYKDMYVLH